MLKFCWPPCGIEVVKHVQSQSQKVKKHCSNGVTADFEHVSANRRVPNDFKRFKVDFHSMKIFSGKPKAAIPLDEIDVTYHVTSISSNGMSSFGFLESIFTNGKSNFYQKHFLIVNVYNVKCKPTLNEFKY